MLYQVRAAHSPQHLITLQSPARLQILKHPELRMFQQVC